MIQAAIASHDGCQDDREQHASDEVEGSFGQQADDSIGARQEGVDRDTVECLGLACRDRVAKEVHRDAHDLALLLAQTDEVVDPRRPVERKADRHFVDDASVEDVLDLVEGTERRTGD